MPVMAGGEQHYSTLEVAPHIVYPEYYESQGTQKQLAPNTDAPEPYHPNTPPKASNRKRWIIIGVVAALCVLAIVLGGVLGTQLHHNGSTETSSSSAPPNATTTASPNVNVLSNSRLAACNYTDSQNVNHRTVFFQDAHGNLIAQLWDSKNTVWSMRNISDAIGSSIGLKFAPNSPLVTAATDAFVNVHELHVWWLDNSYQVQSVWWNWETNTLRFASDIFDAKLMARPGSSLAATWKRPGKNDTNNGFWHVVYQSTNGDIKDAAASGWQSPDTAVTGGNVDTNSSLTILPMLQNYWLSRLVLMWQTNGAAKTSTWNRSWDDAAADTNIFSNLPNPSPDLQFASTAWGNWNQMLFLALQPSGTVTSNWWDGSKYRPISATEFTSGPAVNFSAIATTTDAMFYGISGDQVLEYSISQSNPSTFKYTGVVFG